MYQQFDLTELVFCHLCYLLLLFYIVTDLLVGFTCRLHQGAYQTGKLLGLRGTTQREALRIRKDFPTHWAPSCLASLSLLLSDHLCFRSLGLHQTVGRPSSKVMFMKSYELYYNQQVYEECYIV